MGFFEAFGEVMGSIGSALFPRQSRSIGSLTGFTEFSQSLDKMQKGLEDNGREMTRLANIIDSLGKQLQQQGFQEPAFAHDSIEEALRLR
jgi:hypothetical protein